MTKKGEIIVIDDDPDDQGLLDEALTSLGYKDKIKFFNDGDTALSYLKDCEILPFLILSDINMPKLNGLELREKIIENPALEKKCIPYIFYTTAGTPQAVDEAYEATVQGFFIKPSSFPEIRNTIRKIVEYWEECVSPNYNQC